MECKYGNDEWNGQVESQFCDSPNPIPHPSHFSQQLSDTINSWLTEASAVDFLATYDLRSDTETAVLESKGKFIEVHSSRNLLYVIHGDLTSHMLTVYENGVSLGSTDTAGCIDLDPKGKRWEGRVKDGKPFGYGTLYDDEDHKEYEGFMFCDSRVCYGNEFYRGIEAVMYEGCFCDDKQFGRGVQYGRNGTVDYDGYWINGHKYYPRSDGLVITNNTECLEIPMGSLKDSKLLVFPCWAQSLRTVIIHSDCFGEVRLFELDGMNELESVIVGSDCFSKLGIHNKLDIREIPLSFSQPDGLVRFVNCPKLRFIQIGENSFDHHFMELHSLPSLQSIIVSDYSFYYATSFVLIGISIQIA